MIKEQQKEFNLKCAEFMGIADEIEFFQDDSGDYFLHEKYLYDPYSDANLRNKVIEKMILQGYEFTYYQDDGQVFLNVIDSSNNLIIDVHEGSIQANENTCIDAVLGVNNE